jgi:putative FmdB family regulatory protein
MPIFEYECGKCGHQFEYLVLPTTPAATCPSCKSRKLNQMISLCSVSSESTRENALRDGRRRNKKIGREQAHEEHKAYHAERDHHH